ncbi:rubrerythrin family protein [Paenibacillus rhizosphaerae]|uniref:Rubrerythrin family protein n=1 Tax=Paenibacillus rhizosphaerae TaxID=297318 RepID=A0A1R1EF95_9BACL|nr:MULTISPECIES: ferritin-like domain-containing protein [Paenibacillus]OMF50503.1 rubrerythrin family protein [Paenibacillus rhizosphaerae]OXL85661.1 rubrerythrin family protein [Paenibacillus sp. SSG-1]
MYYYTWDYRAPASSIGDLEKAINGEYSAVACYERLAGAAPNEEERTQIMEIRKDEIRHYQTFAGLYTSLTGRQPAPVINEPCPSVYRDGLHFAFKDEQNTVDFYHEAADRASDPAVKQAFLRAAADEQNHAVWFLYFLTKQQARE